MAKGTVGAKLVLEGESKYKSALKEIKTAQSELRSELKLCASEFKTSQNSITALQAKYNVLGKQVEQTQRKYDTYNSALEEAQKVQASLATSLDDAKTAYAEAAKRMDELKTSAGTSNEELAEQQQVMDQLAQEVDDAQNKYDQCSKKVTEYQTALNYAGAELADFKTDQAQTKKYLDEAEASMDGCATSIDEYGKETEDATEQTNIFGDALAANLASEAIISGVKALVGTVKTIASACIETGAQFEKSMSNVAALSGASGAEYDKLANKAREMGAATMYSASQAADALSYMALAGWDTEQMVEGLEPVLNLAAASDMDLAEASDIVTDYITAFGLSVADASKFTDQMAYAMANSNTNTEQLGEAYKNCAATAGSLGYSVEDTTAALMVMANAGVKGGEAGTGLSTIMTRLATDTKDCASELEEYGVHVYDAQGNMQSLSSILTGVGEVWETLTDKEQASLAKMIAGTSQYSKFQTIMTGLSESAKESGMSFEDYAAALETCDGAAAQMAETMQDNLKGKLTIMQSALEACEESAYSLFDDALKEGVEGATDALTVLNDSIVNGDMNVALSNMGEALADFMQTTVQLATDALPTLISGLTWVIENADTIVSGIAGVTAGMVAYKTATAAADVAAKLLNTTISLGPWGIVAAAVTGLAAAIATAKLTQTASDMQQLADATSNLCTSISNLTANREEERASMEANASAVKKLVKELEDETTTSARKAQIVDELNGIMTDLNLTYDAQADKLSMSNEELEANTDALMRNMEVAAAQEDLTEIATERYDAEKKLAEITQEVAEKYGIEADSSEELAEKLRESAAAQEEFNNQETLYAGMDAGYAKDAEDLRALADAIDETTDTMSSLDEEYATVNEYIDNNTAALEGNTTATGENTDAVNENADATTQWSDDIIESYEKAFKTIHSSLEGASDDFETLGQQMRGAADETEVSLSDMQTQMEDWANGIDTYAQSVARAEEIMGSDSKTTAYLQSLIDKGPSAKAELDAVTDAYDSNREAFDELCETYNEATNMLDSLAELEAGFESGYTDAYTAGLEAIQASAPQLQTEMETQFDAEKTVVEEKTAEIADTLAEGLSSGIEENTDTVKEATTTLVEDGINNPISEETGVDGSASTKTTEVGEYIDAGLVAGMENGKTEVITTAETLAADLYAAFETNLASDKFNEIGKQICAGLVSGINSGRSDVIKAATQMAADAYEAAKKELDIHSPSKKFAWLGQMSGEGYVEGLKSSMASVKSVMAAAVPSASAGIKVGKLGGSAIGGNVINQTVNVYSPTENMIDVARAFKQSQKEAARAW